MSGGRRRKRSGKGQGLADDAFWGADDEAPPPPPKVVPGPDPTAVVRSLGPIPLPVHEDLAAAQLSAVYRNAARVATAVAASAGLVDLAQLAGADDDDA